MEQNLSAPTSVACLRAFRILSREKTHMESLVSEKALHLLIKLAGIEYYAGEQGESVTIQDGDQDG